MTGPIIPADQWPEGADRHCWDANGLGVFYGPPNARVQVWLPVMKLSNIPTPAGHDWRVPVMRQPAINLEQLRKTAADAMNLIAHVSWAWNGTGQHPNTIYTELQSLLALIDGQAKCRACNGNGEIGGLLPNGGGYDSQSCPDCNSEQPTKGEGE